MDWKEFLKPDWRRLLIAVVICGIINGLLNCFFVDTDCLSKTAVNLVGGPEGFIEGLFDLFLLSDIPIAGKILAVVISYLLSCLIVYPYEKHKKK
jgi:hypothetical protein